MKQESRCVKPRLWNVDSDNSEPSAEDCSLVERVASVFSDPTSAVANAEEAGVLVHQFIDLLEKFRSEYLTRVEHVVKERLWPLLGRAIESEYQLLVMFALAIVSAVFDVTGNFLDYNPAFRNIVIRRVLQAVLCVETEQAMLTVACELLKRMLLNDGQLRTEFWQSGSMVRVIDVMETLTDTERLRTYSTLLLCFALQEYTFAVPTHLDHKAILAHVLRGIGLLHTKMLYPEFLNCLSWFFPRKKSEKFRLNMIIETDYLEKANSQLAFSLVAWREQAFREESDKELHRSVIHYGIFLVSTMFVSLSWIGDKRFFEMIPWSELAKAFCDRNFEDFFAHMFDDFSAIVECEGHTMVDMFLDVNIYRDIVSHLEDLPFLCKCKAILFLMKSLQYASERAIHVFLFEYHLVELLLPNMDANDRQLYKQLIALITSMLTNPAFMSACRDNVALFEALSEDITPDDDNLATVIDLFVKQLQKEDMPAFEGYTYVQMPEDESDHASCSPCASGDEC